MKFGLIVLTTALLLAGLWTAGSGWRESRAAGYDTKMEQALQANNLSEAYRHARYANAFSDSGQRLLTLGSLAYLRRDFDAALHSFQRIDAASSLAAEARNGSLLAAAAAGNRKKYGKYKTAAGSSEKEKVILAQAALDIGDMEGLSKACACTSRTRTMAYLAAAGNSVEDPASSRNALVAATTFESVQASAGRPYDLMIKTATDVSSSGYQRLQQALTKIAAVASPGSRRTLLANALYEEGGYRAVKTLAQDALAIDPKYRDAWNLLAAAQISQKEFKDAERSLRTSLDLDTAFAETWHLKAELEAAREKPDEAEEYKKKAAALGYRALR